MNRMLESPQFIDGERVRPPNRQELRAWINSLRSQMMAVVAEAHPDVRDIVRKNWEWQIGLQTERLREDNEQSEFGDREGAVQIYWTSGAAV